MATKYELSKTYQYRKVMKPLLERKRRARINKCLDDLKDIIGECMQQQNTDDPNAKLEKADILELTVQHLRKLRAQRQQQQQQQTSGQISGQRSFRYGYIQAANEVSRCLAMLPKVNVEFGTKLMTHLGLRLNQLESNQQTHDVQPTPATTPLTISCHSMPTTTMPALYSPVSSGYASDNESLRHSSPLPTKCNNISGLLQVVPTPVWRPW